MREPETGWTEADIIINGQPLSFQESMTLRVAVASMQLQMNNAESKKGLGKLAEAYAAHLASIHMKIIAGTK